MKKLIFAALLTMGAGTAVFAQGTNQGTSTNSQTAINAAAQTETNKWVQALGLTTQQKIQIHEINLDIEKQRAYLLSVGTAAHPDRFVALQRQKNNRYQAVLTPQQYTTYLSML